MEQQSAPVNSVPSILKIALFGTLTLTRDDRPLRLATRKIQLLLAYLVLFPGPHLRDHLATLFWGDTTDDQARHSLRTALHTLRSTIGGTLIHTGQAMVQLNPHFPLWVDAWDLRRTVQRTTRADGELRTALKLYHDDLLAGSYDDWVLSERERYQALYIDGMLALIQELRTQSNYLEASAVARRVIERDPLNEPAHQHLIFCLVALGQRSAGLQQFEVFRRTLHDELGAEPAPETLSLVQWARRAPPTGQSAARVSNLPIPLTSFVGRDHTRAELADLLRLTRLLTLIGAGGSGKTRLAIQIGAAVLDRFPDGIWWVELGVLRDAALVPRAVADSLGLREQPGETLPQGLIRLLHMKQLLLVLDNCEHLVPACVRLLGALLSRCPQLRALATSRTALQLPGERVYLVPPLTLPPEGGANAPELVGSYEAARLFVERARAVEPSFALTRSTTPAVVHICRQLDGLPLALELAAAQLGTLTVQQMAERLENRFSLPAPHPQAMFAHQQTLRTTMDWSYELLTTEEQTLLRRLGVFAGHFSLEAVEHICGPLIAPALDLLGRLVNRSLVLVDYAAEEPHYGLLTIIQQYVQEHLSVSGEEARLRAAHLAYYGGLAEAVYAHYHDAEHTAWLLRLEAAHDNIRVALHWALSEGDPLAALRLGAILGEFWEVCGHWAEGRRWLEQILAIDYTAHTDNAVKAEARRWLALALWQAGAIVWRQCDYDRARRLMERSIELYRTLQNWQRLTQVLSNLAGVYYEQGDFAAARILYEEALALRKTKLNNREDLALGMFGVGLAAIHQGDYAAARPMLTESTAILREFGRSLRVTFPLNTLGNLANLEGDYAAAEACYSECLALRREVGNQRGVAATLSDLANVRLKQGDYAAALSYYRESLTIFQELGNGRGVACALSGLGRLAQIQGQPLVAARLHGAAATRLERLGAGLDEPERSDRERAIAELRTILPSEQFDSAWAEGAAMSVEALLA